MTANNELWMKSLILSQEFDRYVLEHPRFAEKIPRGAQVVLLPNYDKALRAYNSRNARINKEPGRPVVHVEIEEFRPRKSQIVRPRLKSLEKNSGVKDRDRRRKHALS